MRSTPMRTTLSMLGIIIGVASVIVMLAIGQWTQNSILERFNSMWANNITISAWNTSSNVRSSQASAWSIDDDFLDFIRSIDGVQSMSPTVRTSKQVIFRSNNANAQIIGVMPIYKTVKNLEIADGSFVTEDYNNSVAKVAVLGHDIATDLFDTQDPIGKDIQAWNVILTIIGVLADNSQSNSSIYVPLSTAQYKIIGTSFYDSVDVTLDSSDKVTPYKTFFEDITMEYFHVTDLADNPVTVSSLNELLQSVEQVSWTLKLFLWFIAAISLLVWGIGVMNIMLVSVTERTREIGIRKAIWARRNDILSQFLVESVILSLSWWIIGVLLSYLIKWLLRNIITAVISIDTILLAFLSAVCIGIVFGILPASKASNLKPIDALRFE